ncbi:MAG: hypothetical protein KF802_15600 [Bdellovibrionaceae bacterium]|nr:hypothetical protein [Pseudobdellovibrionaceae bacterium]
MALIFSVPGKTFLAGEYLALEGGLTLLAMSEPRFEMRVELGAGRRAGLSEGSPAMNYIRRHEEFFRGLDLTFRDPHEGAGGLGASTAQYLTVFAMHSWKSAANDEADRELDTKALLENYRQDSWNGEGKAPSGADLIGQLKGGFTFFERQTGLISRGAWPFAEIVPVLIRTGVKVPTHEHLRRLNELDVTDLAPVMTAIRQAWNDRDDRGFADHLNRYGKALAKKGLTAESTLDLLHDLAWMESVAAAKGCGALGADFVLALVRRDLKRSFDLWAEEKELTTVQLLDHVSPGLALKVEKAVPLMKENSL